MISSQFLAFGLTGSVFPSASMVKTRQSEDCHLNELGTLCNIFLFISVVQKQEPFGRGLFAPGPAQ